MIVEAQKPFIDMDLVEIIYFNGNNDVSNSRERKRMLHRLEKCV
jgi:hypothetical protein